MGIKILFSDIDGTCVHYADGTPFNLSVEIHPDGSLDLSENGRIASVLRLPPSTSGSVGIISVKTLQLYQAIRSMGVKLVLITGARLTTLLARLPYLPACDAYCCESGGRIFYPSAELGTAAPIREDIEWRQRHASVAGPMLQDSVPPGERQGELWDFFRQLVANSASVDATSYTTAFRVRKLESIADFLQETLPRFPSLSTATNLGAADVYPSTSGKRNVAQYLMSRFGAASDGSDSVFMCDDDNDIELALAVKKAYLPSITASTLAAVVEQNPSQFHVSQEERVWATEDILTIILQELVL